MNDLEININDKSCPGKKRIVILCDGTWNSPDKLNNGIECPTNVVKIAKSIKDFDTKGNKQLTYYDPGIGTSGLAIKRWYNGATGTGISKNILLAYKYLIMNYEIGDELYFFGFSRGAFTVRSLVGLIYNSGILRRNCVELIDKAYKLYKSRSSLTHPKANEAVLFRKTYAIQDSIPVKFIGVWDTVGSLGNPLFINNIFSKISFSIVANSFHDTNISPIVENAFQALAIDEKRRNFSPTLWEPNKFLSSQNLEQMWFVGVHSNIGGGYTCSALSDISLEWMRDKAQKCGLCLDDFHHNHDILKSIHNSYKGFYRLIPKYNRVIGNTKWGNEQVHETAIQKYYNDPNYRAKNLIKYLTNNNII